MSRGEDDEKVLEQSPEFNDQPGSGKHLGGRSVRDEVGADHDRAESDNPDETR